MNDIQKNKAVIQQFYKHISSREYDQLTHLFDKDVVWWILGNMSTSGTYSGRETVTKLFGHLKDNLVGALKLNILALTAEEDRVSVEMTSEGKMTNGLDYCNSYHLLFWIQNGLIKRVHEYLDTLYTQETINKVIEAGA